MNQAINDGVASLNGIGKAFLGHAAGVFVQTGILVILLLAIDLLLRRRVRAVFRYCIWLLVLVKLVLPPTLSLPSGIGYWVGSRMPVASPIPQRVSKTTGYESARLHRSAVAEPSGESPQVPPPSSGAQTDALATSVAPSLTPIAWQAVVFLVWLVGVLAFGLLLAQRLRFVKGLVAASTPAGGDLLGLLEQCRRQMGVRRPVGLRTLNTAASPAVCGLLRPTILMPAPLVERLSPEGLRAALIHELAHIKRADLWVNSVQTFLQVVYFYNPFVWLANAIIRRTCEEAVDETVLVTLGGEAKNYSNTLIDIGEMAFWKADLGLRLVGVAESKRALQGRIRHMLTRPVPKSASIGLRGFLAILTTAAVLLPMAKAQDTNDRNEASGGYGILLLDDRDPEYTGKDHFDDCLYLLDSSGNIEGAVSGLNFGESIGGSHRMAVDPERKTAWVVEGSGARLWHFDLATGKLLGQTPGLPASACAVDQGTGNAWVMISEGLIGKGHIQVVSSSGQPLIQHPVPGFDIDYSRSDGCFWVVGTDVYRLNRDGKVLGQIKGQIPWTAVSVSVDQKTGAAWIVVREHTDLPESPPELWQVDPNMQIRKRIDLGDLIPFCVAADSDNEGVWVGCLGTTLHFSTRGQKLHSARYASGYSVVPAASARGVWAADRFGVIQANILESGRVEMHSLRGENQPQLGQNSRWLARVPFAGARLESSKELNSLTEYKARQQWLAEHPELEGRMKRLYQALMMYANDYEDKLPGTPQDIQRSGGKDILNAGDLEWLAENVEYCGRGKTTSVQGDTVIAYDKATAARGKGTGVLYASGEVKYESPQQLERRGIKTRP